ncbi:DUF397 domain-containing protein [Streptomyces sp. BH-SS-21]|uniref:DUF397 domain-containing protein n=1 Tax=Streptomyces liliiviolaceus TaxID=2823109 RepID=A0A941B6K5_9ACTN|nr:DUF397 domain-containing protein [Streptomyces liliiviolaceus]MBQ0852595.1 DUF397 domain-containing protein [Streptomyces liliiviolaceus]
MSITELTWFKSSYSGSDGDDCVEVAVCAAATIHVRDSKNARGPQLALSPAAWGTFIQRVSGPRSTA